MNIETVKFVIIDGPVFFPVGLQLIGKAWDEARLLALGRAYEAVTATADWRTLEPGTVDVEFGFSCMGYEISGALGAKMARPGNDVICWVGDGSYLMLSNEIATAYQEAIQTKTP